MTLAEIRRAGSIAPFVRRIERLVIDISRYGLVSVAGLICDYAVLMGAVALDVHYLVASFLGFTFGAFVVYALCIRFVFADRRGTSRESEFVGFFAIGLLGLALTEILLWLFVSRLGIPVGLAKFPTVAIVFFFNFFGRSRLVFTR